MLNFAAIQAVFMEGGGFDLVVFELFFRFIDLFVAGDYFDRSSISSAKEKAWWLHFVSLCAQIHPVLSS